MKTLAELATICYIEANSCIRCFHDSDDWHILCGNPQCHETLCDVLRRTPLDKLPSITVNLQKYSHMEWKMCSTFIRELLTIWPDCFYHSKNRLEAALMTGVTSTVLSSYNEVEQNIIDYHFYLECENSFMYYDKNCTYEQVYVELSILYRCLSHYGEMYNVDELIEKYPTELHLHWEDGEQFILTPSSYISEERGIEITMYSYEMSPFLL